MNLFTVDISNVCYLFDLKNPSATYQRWDFVKQHMDLLNQSKETFNLDEYQVISEMKLASQKMTLPINEAGGYAYYLEGAIINLDFFTTFTRQESNNLSYTVSVLRGIREKMQEQLIKTHVTSYKKAGKVLADWLFFFENL